MYRLAIISDVHADVHALTDALAAIDRLACDAIVCAGDVVAPPINSGSVRPRRSISAAVRA